MGTFVIFFPHKYFPRMVVVAMGYRIALPSSKLQVLCLLHTVSYILLASLTFCQHKHNLNKNQKFDKLPTA